MPFRPSLPSNGTFRSWASDTESRPRLQEVPPAAPNLADVEDLQELLAAARAEAAEEARAESAMELAQLREVVDTLLPLVEEVETLKRAKLEETAEAIAELVRVVSRRVVGDALATNPEAIAAVVKQALQQLPEREGLTIVVSATASEQITRALPKDLQDRLIVDPDIQAGLVVRTRDASLDATLETVERGLDLALSEWLSEQWWAEGEPS